ncbi:MAG: gliding motility-associated C-terminal domain-containing protein [Saprospiraceae bacterium]|nr:gliding motility-associated C-terminal domain-containing protein [Saprospiraceae bacterium]
MRFFSILFVCISSLCSTPLSAKPTFSTFSGPADTLLLIENLEVEENIPTVGLEPDSRAVGKEGSLAPTVFVQNDLCGQGLGFIEVTPDPNTQGPWVYVWSNGETVNPLLGLTTGFYQVSVFDANNNFQVVQAFVGELPPIAPLSITGAITGNTLCNGTSNGAIDLTVDPLPASWSYLWSNGSTDMDLVNIDPGTYTVSVTFGVTCTTVEEFVVPNLTVAPILSPPIGGFDIDFCETGNGSASVFAQGGVPPYTYEWSNGATDFQIFNLVEGEYTVTVTGDNGCSSTLSGLVPAGDLPVVIEGWVVTPNTTCIGNNGSISITYGPAGNWTPTATFLWTNGATTQNISNLSSGTYFVTVTRLGTCTDVEGFYIEDEPILPALSFTNTTASCGLSNGAINLTTLPGGIAPYTYLWSNGATTEDLANIPGGSYDVTLTSSNGCTSTGNVIVEDNQAIFSYSATVTDQTACDTINGRISLSLFPANLAYTWSNGATTTNLSPLAPGNYTVTISAGGTCTAEETYLVGDLREYPIIPALLDTSTCGLANGGIDLIILGNAVAPLTYQWSNGATTQDLTGILADTFTVIVTSATGCSNTNTFIVPNFNDTIRIQENVIDNFSCTAPTGAIDLNVTPLDSSYVFIWSNGQTTDSLYNLTAGNYLVTVTLGVSCIALDTFTVINNALPPNLSASGGSTNCGLDNGSADLTVSGGTGPFGYLWSNAATTEDLANLTPGTYSVTVTGANSCTAVSAATVLNNNIPLNVNGVPLGNTSCATANGSVDIAITPAGTYNYLWSNAATTEDLNNLSPGTYTVTVSLGTCLSTSTFSIADEALSPNLSAAGTSADCGQNDGAADLSVSGGTGPFTYLWSNTAITEDLANLLPGTYTVTVTGANSCTAINAVTVLNNNIPLNVTAAPVGNTSCTTANGSIDIIVAPAGTYAYLWSNAATDEDLNNLSAGVYTVTVTLGTCQSTSTFSIADNTATPVLDQAITASICGVNNGGIDLSVSGPTGPYTYIWSNMATTEDLASLLPGNYSITVTAPNGCTEVATINVPNNASTFSLAATPAPLTDCSADNGAIDLSITPAGAYTYLWSNMATTEDLSGLPPGTYTVSVTESGSCTATASYFVIDQRSNPLSSQTIVPELCGQTDGSIDLSVSGGTVPFGYNWASGHMSEDLNNIPAGTYFVTVTDANNCTVTASAVVPGNSISFALAGTPSANSSCIQNNGAIDLSVNPPGGVTYLWSNMAVTEDLNGLNAGTYTVTVSAGGNCTNTAAFTITSNVPTPLLAQNITAASCGQASGAIDLTVSGSPAPYQFDWSNAAMGEDLNGILSGNYTVTVTAANGCSTVENYTVPENSFSPAIGSALSPASSCTVNNGAIDLTITPAGTYTYLWSNAAITEDLANIAAGIYTVTVSAGGACSSTAVLMVPSNVPLPSISNNIAAATCGQVNGSIDLSVMGSVAPYDFIWSNAATTEDLSNTVSGTFTVTVTAANGCSSVGNYTVPENVILPQINGTLTAATSCVVNNGAIDLTVGPATGYTFLWSNAAITEDLLNIAAGTYTVTVNGGGACTGTANFTVTSNVPVPSLSNNIVAATCGQANGSIDLSVTGSPAPYGFSWSNAATSEDLLNIVSGQFTVTVTAANGCTSTGNFTVPDNGISPLISGTPTADNSCATNNGAIDLVVGPATGYTFIWSNAAITEDLSNLAPGTYTVTVNGGGACTNTASFVIADQTTQPQASIAANTTALDCSTISTTLNGTVTGTANPSTLQWLNNGNPVGSGSSLMVNAPGQYVLVVSDDVTFCTATASITITQNLNPPTLSVANPALLTCSNPLQTLTGSSTVGGVQFSWATIIGTDTTILGSGTTFPVSTAGTYYLLGLNPANNCANGIPVNVTADIAPPTANAGAPFTVDCAGETAGLNGSGSGAPNLTYSWTTQDGHFVSGAMTANPLIDEAGTYQLLVTNPANGCTDTDAVTIDPEVPVAFASVQQPTCQELQGTVHIDSVTGLSDPILYSLNNSLPSVQNQFTNLAPGTYTVEVQGGNGCNATTVVVVEAPDLVVISLVPTAEIGLGENYQIDATVNIPPSDIASINWTPSTGLECDTCLNTGAMPDNTTNYQLLVISKAGCEARGSLLLTVDKTRKIYAPNIFSPNEDGTNDEFTIFADPVSVERIKSLQVYSRWGEQVFERKDFSPIDTNIGWDGTFKGQNLNPAVFIWQATVLFADGKEELFTGDVTLQR